MARGVCALFFALFLSFGPRNGTTVSLTCGGTNCGSSCTPSSGSTSGNIVMNYPTPPVDCWWFMTSPTGSDISIEFPVFETRLGYVRIFQCQSTECKYEDMIAQLSGDSLYNEVWRCNKNQCSSDELVRTENSLRTDEVFTSTTGFLRMTFNGRSDWLWDNFEATWKGMLASTTTPPPETTIAATTPPPAISQTKCPSGTTRTTAVATIMCGKTNCGGLPDCSWFEGAEGSFSDVAGNYQSNANCYWALATSLDAEIRISFPYFDTDNTDDWVEVFRCTDDSCSTKTQELRKSGSLEATNVYTSSTGFLQVIFTSNYQFEYGGFSAAWSVGGACTDCTAGKYSTDIGAPSDTACIACGAGKYSAAPGASSCLDCAAGKYSSALGVSVCLDCTGVTSSASEGNTNEAGCVHAILRTCPPGTAPATAVADITCAGVNCGGLPACSRSSGATSVCVYMQ